MFGAGLRSLPIRSLVGVSDALTWRKLAAMTLDVCALFCQGRAPRRASAFLICRQRLWSERAILTPQRRASHPVSRRLRCQERGLSFGRLSLKLSTEATGGVYPMAETQVSIRIDLDTGGRIGPGKIALLEAISKTGSITAAARSIICPIVERGSGRDK
jgi:hypothetical protein